jgi:ABC-type branched-subunit amino acid transport system ATPase component
MSQPIIDARNLIATYGPMQALKGVSLAVEKGEIRGRYSVIGLMPGLRR